MVSSSSPSRASAHKEDFVFWHVAGCSRSSALTTNLLRRLQSGELIEMPHSRPMPSVGKRVHELRVIDLNVTWRILYRLDDDVIRLSNGKTMTKADKLIGYILAEYIDGDDSEPTRSDCVDRYAFHALEKHEAFAARSSAPKAISPKPSAPHSATRPNLLQKE